MTGIIKKKTDKGFGFIAVDGSDDVFFHSSALMGLSWDDINEGDTVSFDTEQVDKNGDGQMKTNATNVQKA